MWSKWSLRARGGGMSLTYAIADLHGRFDLLTAAFDAIVKHAAERSFKIITLGDYVDRGPQSRQIIDHLMAAQEMGVSLICLKGNHEDMMVETLRRPLHPNWWIDNGGGQTLISYGPPLLRPIAWFWSSFYSLSVELFILYKVGFGVGITS